MIQLLSERCIGEVVNLDLFLLCLDLCVDKSNDDCLTPDRVSQFVQFVGMDRILGCCQFVHVIIVLILCFVYFTFDSDS